MHNNDVETIEYKGCTIRIVPNDSPESPREWDNLGTMICSHRNYNLGDEQIKCSGKEYLRDKAAQITTVYEQTRDLEIRTNTALRRVDAWDHAWYRGLQDSHATRLEKILDKAIDEHFIILPLYLMDHSGLSISTGSFSCPWDSGRVGSIYCPMAKARKEYKGTDIEIRKQAIECMQGEVATYDSYLRGDVVGYIAEDPDEEQIASCWGFYPDDSAGYSKRWDDPIDQAKAEIDGWVEDQEKEAVERKYWEAREVITE